MSFIIPLNSFQFHEFKILSPAFHTPPRRHFSEQISMGFLFSLFPSAERCPFFGWPFPSPSPWGTTPCPRPVPLGPRASWRAPGTSRCQSPGWASERPMGVQIYQIFSRFYRFYTWYWFVIVFILVLDIMLKTFECVDNQLIPMCRMHSDFLKINRFTQSTSYLHQGFFIFTSKHTRRSKKQHYLLWKNTLLIAKSSLVLWLSMV